MVLDFRGHSSIILVSWVAMNYEEAVAYIEETPKFTTKNKLEHTRECLRRLGEPQNAFRVIHVAGTNGKGSTCAFLASMLQKAGYSCGLFTSPHLVTIRERFQINEKRISREAFLHAFARVKALADELVAEGSYHPTYFEMLFLMGMLIFAEAGVDYVVLETGLGGRLDATTAVEHPLACVITSISYDHMQYLGDTIEEIAGEKAGILVPGVPVIYDANDPVAAKVIRERAAALGCGAVALTAGDTEILETGEDGIRFRIFGSDHSLEASMADRYETGSGDGSLEIPFIAAYQVRNAALAVKTIQVLQELHQVQVSGENIRDGLLSTRWEGRMETILPGVVVDGAHNEDGIRKFVETAARFQEKYPLTLLFSSVEDKDYEDMIHEILSAIHFRSIVVTQVGGNRQVPAGNLCAVFERQGCLNVEAHEDIQEAFSRALVLKGEDGMLFCAGSLYLVGEIKRLLKENSF